MSRISRLEEWCREEEREEEEGLLWRALLLSERCLLSGAEERASDSCILMCAPLISTVVIVLALSRGISSTGTRTVRRMFESNEYERF